MKRKASLLLIMTTCLLVLLGQSVYAFSDTQGDPNESQIEGLHKKGILSGNGSKFNPKGKLSNAEGIALLVKGFDLKDDNVYIKEPKASDSFTKVKDDAWYAPAFVIAHAEGLDLPRDIEPAAAMTREQFAHYLFQAMTADRELAFIQLAILYDDEDQVTPAYRNSVQNLLITNIAKLDHSKFNPKQSITRGTAAGWLYNAIQFVKDQEDGSNNGGGGSNAYDMKLSVQPVNPSINEVTVTATLPNPGYGLRISSITFRDQTAVIAVEVKHPDPDRVYPQVLTEAKAVTYVSAEYAPVLDDTNVSVTSSSASTGAISIAVPESSVSAAS
ncbi:S-layer homology domain-containing protein [Paenibacillus kobensis]|uniref:S-layer homology domain-containing protein n=1 Tax=Paenibacillus kobensis TaxID=59841 RepID=UPI000FD80446|nr:S-layer homology domain-containing protein [Paenibacillus kobensis]